MKLSKSESGKLGAVKSALVSNKQKEDRIYKYKLNPKKCLQCPNEIPYEKRTTNKFCSRTCSAIYTNARKDWANIVTGPIPGHKKEITTKRVKKIKVDKFCPSCYIPVKGVYCSTHCRHTFNHTTRINNWLNHNVYPGKANIKKYLVATYGNECACCKIVEWNNKSIVLELEHKDGNSENNTPDNLCLICPNCHSQTDTFKGKNRGNGRHARRIRYAEGKSF